MKLAVIAVLSVASLPAFAGAPVGSPGLGSHVDLYYSNLDFEVSDDTDSASIDGDGGGIGFWLGNNIGLLTAELQKNSLDGSPGGFTTDADIRTMRVGLGYRLLNTPTQGAWIRAEYVNFDGDIEIQDVGSGSDKQDGYGIHAGGMLGAGIVNGYGEIGFVDVDDLDGMEYTLGLNVQPGMVGGFVEYRVTDLELDNIDLDEKFEDLRIGLRLAF